MRQVGERACARLMLTVFKEANDANDSLTITGTATSPLQATNQNVLHALLARFLTEDVLNIARHGERRSEQGAKEDKK